MSLPRPEWSAKNYPEQAGDVSRALVTVIGYRYLRDVHLHRHMQEADEFGVMTASGFMPLLHTQDLL